MRLKSYCCAGIGVYSILSMTDLLFTYALLRTNSEAVEANPVAAVWLEQYGWYGLAAFKSASVLVFIGAILLLTQRRPAIAAGVVTFGCLVLLAVTTYSNQLIRESEQEAAEQGVTQANDSPEEPGIELLDMYLFAAR